jgi:hypothetical protein
MDDSHKRDSRGRPSKEGRPSNLAFYRQSWCPAASIIPLPGAPANCDEWFQLYGGYIFRTFSTGEATDLFDIPETMRAYIRGRLEQIATRPDEPAEPKGPDEPPSASKQKRDTSPKAQLARWFEPPVNPSLELDLPPLHLSNDAWENAVSLARRLISVAGRHPYLVRSAVLGYCYAATTHRYVTITDATDAEYGEMLFKLFDELHLEGPVIRYVGFRKGSSRNDVSALARAFGLRSAPEDYETANNLDSPVRLNHIGIRVCWGNSHRSSPEWHQVAVLAAATELWRCVTGTDGRPCPL